MVKYTESLCDEDFGASKKFTVTYTGFSFAYWQNCISAILLGPQNFSIKCTKHLLYAVSCLRHYNFNEYASIVTYDRNSLVYTAQWSVSLYILYAVRGSCT